MKKNIQTLFFSLKKVLFVASLGLTMMIACKKGDQGPAGPAGPAGPSGPSGPTGPTGTANVIYSNWQRFIDANWTSVVRHTKNIRVYTIVDPGVTNEIINRGAVLVYYRQPLAGINPRPLPFQLYNYLSANSTQQIQHELSTGKIYIEVSNLENNNLPSIVTAASEAEIRYIIIPGGIASGRIASGSTASYSLEQLRRMPYDDVIRLMNIPENGTYE